MTKKIEPLSIETYEDIKKMKESNYDYWDKEDHSRYVEAKIVTKLNQVIEAVNKLQTTYDKTD